MKKAFTVGLFFLGIITGYSQSDDIHINQLQVIGSHNSYKQAIEKDLYNVLYQKDSAVAGLQYTHIPIPQQLTMGLRNLEIDVYADTRGGKYAHPKGLDITPAKQQYDADKQMMKPGFKVFHMPDIDFRTSAYIFEECLTQLKKWSDANPGHTPVFITLEPKDGDKNRFGTQPEKFTEKLFDDLDSVLVKSLGKDKIITPDVVRGHYKTLEEAVLNNNWPLLRDARGKFMFILDDKGDKMQLYKKGHPSLKGRMIFINADPGTPEAAAMFRNDAKDTSIPELVNKGYIIRTRADINTNEARKEDYSLFKTACNSGAQIITTDYYLPSTLFKSNYKVSFDDNKYVRNNPVNKTK